MDVVLKSLCNWILLAMDYLGFICSHQPRSVSLVIAKQALLQQHCSTWHGRQDARQVPSFHFAGSFQPISAVSESSADGCTAVSETVLSASVAAAPTVAEDAAAASMLRRIQRESHTTQPLKARTTGGGRLRTTPPPVSE